MKRTFSSKICNIDILESHSNTAVHQFEAINPFRWYLVIPKYFVLNTVVWYLLIPPIPSLILTIT